VVVVQLQQETTLQHLELQIAVVVAVDLVAAMVEQLVQVAQVWRLSDILQTVGYHFRSPVIQYFVPQQILLQPQILMAKLHFLRTEK
jgi:hypothetical protein